MNPKSSFIMSKLFVLQVAAWTFHPKKATRKVDINLNHWNCFEVPQYAGKNFIITCLPNHTSKVLQPLDRLFFTSLKHYLIIKAFRVRIEIVLSGFISVGSSSDSRSFLRYFRCNCYLAICISWLSCWERGPAWALTSPWIIRNFN